MNLGLERQLSMKRVGGGDSRVCRALSTSFSYPAMLILE